ncbi:MAG: hypothetical protein R3F21_18140 [Myxococcota bacterium]
MIRPRSFFPIVLAVCAALAPAACREPSVPTWIELPVGRHRVAAELPAGWRFVERDEAWYFERSGARILLADLGPVTGPAVVEELERVRALHRRGHWERVRKTMAELPIRELLRDEARWRSIEADWKRVAWLRVDDGVTPEVRVELGLDPSVDLAIDRLEEMAAEITDRDLASIASEALEALAPETPWEVSAVEPFEISGRPALRLETRERLSHRDVRDHLFVFEEGRLLVLHTRLGERSSIEDGFETIARSLVLLP